MQLEHPASVLLWFFGTLALGALGTVALIRDAQPPRKPSEVGRGRGHSLLFTVILSCPARRTHLALPWAGGLGRIFRAASQPSWVPFHPVTPRPLTSAHRAGAHWAPFTLSSPGGRTGKASSSPAPSDPNPTSDHTQAGWDQRRFSFPRDRIGIWGRGEN